MSNYKLKLIITLTLISAALSADFQGKSLSASSTIFYKGPGQDLPSSGFFNKVWASCEPEKVGPTCSPKLPSTVNSLTLVIARTEASGFKSITNRKVSNGEFEALKNGNLNIFNGKNPILALAGINSIAKYEAIIIGFDASEDYASAKQDEFVAQAISRFQNTWILLSNNFDISSTYDQNTQTHSIICSYFTPIHFKIVDVCQFQVGFQQKLNGQWTRSTQGDRTSLTLKIKQDWFDNPQNMQFSKGEDTEVGAGQIRIIASDNRDTLTDKLFVMSNFRLIVDLKTKALVQFKADPITMLEDPTEIKVNFPSFAFICYDGSACKVKQSADNNLLRININEDRYIQIESNTIRKLQPTGVTLADRQGNKLSGAVNIKSSSNGPGFATVNAHFLRVTTGDITILAKAVSSRFLEEVNGLRLLEAKEGQPTTISFGVAPGNLVFPTNNNESDDDTATTIAIVCVVCFVAIFSTALSVFLYRKNQKNKKLQKDSEARNTTDTYNEVKNIETEEANLKKVDNNKV